VGIAKKMVEELQKRFTHATNWGSKGLLAEAVQTIHQRF